MPSARHDPRTGGSLVVVGTGIQAIAQTTIGAQSCIAEADEVLYLAGEPFARHWVASLNPRAESLSPFYDGNRHLLLTYGLMVERILRGVRAGLRVCAVFYGSPAVLVHAAREAVAVARSEGYPAIMLPAVSAEDCLLADLGIDPGRRGLQSYEATDFVLRPRPVDTSVPMVLWQVGVVGDHRGGTYTQDALSALTAVLVDLYGAEHQVVLYQAATLAVCDPIADWLALRDLVQAAPSSSTLLFVPPNLEPPIDRAMAERLGFDPAEVSSLAEASVSLYRDIGARVDPGAAGRQPLP